MTWEWLIPIGVAAVAVWWTLVWQHDHPRIQIVRRRFPGRRPPTIAEQGQTRGDKRD